MNTPPVALHLRVALTADEAGALLGLSGGSVRRLVETQVLARVPHTTRLLIARAELDRFATSTMPNQQPGAAA